MAKNLFLALLLSLLVVCHHVAVGDQSEQQTSEARQCRVQRLTASRPATRTESEGGVDETWNPMEDQLQCAGVLAMRSTVQPQSLVLPSFNQDPILVYIQRGRGVLGISCPGCAETYQSSGQRTGGRRQAEQRTESLRDEHQKVRRVCKGELVALPAGVTFWLYNDGNEDLVALSVANLNTQANQLDKTPRSFSLAGGIKRESLSQQEREIKVGNIMQAFDAELMAEAFNIPTELARQMQKKDDRGFIVKVSEGELGMIRPSIEQEQDKIKIGKANGLEETVCNARILHYLDNPEDAEIYSRRAGRINSVNKYSFPILEETEMSAETGKLNPNAILAPHWSVNSHKIMFVTSGEAYVEVVNNQGRTLFSDTVREGELLVVPQYFACIKKASSQGFEWVAFKTSSTPMRSPIVGKTSVFNGMPLQVIANAYRVSLEQAREIKFSRSKQMLLFPPTTAQS